MKSFGGLKNNIGLVCSILSLQATTFANEPLAATIERPISTEVKCNKVTGSCSYQVQNATSRIQVLLTQALQMAFGDSFVIFEDGNSRPFVKGGNTISFRFKDESNKEKFVSALTELDVLEDLSLSPPQVKFTFKVYALDKVAYNNLELGLTAFSNSASPLETPAPRINLSSTIGESGLLKTGLHLNLGNLTSALFGLKLDLSRLGSWSMNSIDYETVVTNGENISAYTNTPTYSKAVSNSVSVEKADIGLNISGRVFLDRNGKRLRIENFFVRYAAPTPDENSIMNETTVSRNNLWIDLSRPYVLGMKTILLDASSKGSNFIFAGKSSKNTISSSLLMVVTAHLVRDEATEKFFAQADAEAAAKILTVAASELQGSTKTLIDSLSSASGFVIPVNQAIGSVLFGQIAGVRIKSENVDRLNAEHIITVIEKNRTSKQSKTGYIKMADLVLNGYSFKTLNFSDLHLPCQNQPDKCQSMKIELEISEMNSTQPPVRLLATYLPEQRSVQLTPNTEPVVKSSGFSRLFAGPQQD